jgi:hypothetical protein
MDIPVKISDQIKIPSTKNQQKKTSKPDAAYWLQENVRLINESIHPA